MKFSNIIKVSVGLGCGLGEVAIPARFDGGRNWIITASVPGLDSHVQVQLTLANRNWLSSFVAMPTVMIPWTLVGGDGVSFGHDYTYDSLTSATYVETHLGLHPESALLKGSGSVALIRASGDRLNREGKLVIGSSLPSFLATCVPGTYMQLNHRKNDASVRFGDDIARPGELEFNHFAGDGILAQISRESLEGIERALTRLGAIPSREFHRHRNFLRCPEALVHSLPPLEVDVVHVGKISFDPVDYLTFDSDGGCRILVDIYRGKDVILNPFRLNGLNVRITRDKTFELCRSAKYSAEATRIGKMYPLGPENISLFITELSSLERAPPGHVSVEEANSYWRQARGEELVAIANRVGDCDRTDTSYCLALMLLISHVPLPDSDGTSAITFLESIGATAFVDANIKYLQTYVRTSIARSHVGVSTAEESRLLDLFSAIWLIRFPRIIHENELMGILLRKRMKAL